MKSLGASLLLGATVRDDGVMFRVWAPRCRTLDVVIEGRRPIALARQEDGMFETLVERSEEQRLNSSHRTISYAVFCLKKNKSLDDVLATGGTARAAANLVEKLCGKVVGFSFVIELDFLKRRSKIAGYDIHALVHYVTDP